MFGYLIKQFVRDFWLFWGNPFNIFSFSPQHLKLIELSPYKSVLHIGADYGQELSLYDSIGVHEVIWVEPNQDSLLKLKIRAVFYKKFKNHFINAFISEFTDDQVKFYKFNRAGASSGFLPLEIFLQSNRKRFVVKEMLIKTLNIEDALKKSSIVLSGVDNLLVIDTQGSELSILKGFSRDTLLKFKVIMCEVSINQYDNKINADLLKSYIGELGFKEILSPIRESDDAVFIRI